MKEVNALNCGRENDLIAFLYGELNDDESHTFRRHLHDCAACGAEFASFQQVRESVVAWRDESLGGVLQVADSSPTRVVVEKPSALAAWRQFFNLAPLWMKGAVAVASILLCLFAGLAIARLRDTPPAVIVTDHSSSEEQINARVESRVQEEVKRRVQEEVDRFKNSTASQPASTTVENTAAKRNSWRQAANRLSVASNSPTQKARRPLSKTEREQLAADLRLVSAKNESDIDLLDDGINQ